MSLLALRQAWMDSSKEPGGVKWGLGSWRRLSLDVGEPLGMTTSAGERVLTISWVAHLPVLSPLVGESQREGMPEQGGRS